MTTKTHHSRRLTDPECRIRSVCDKLRRVEEQLFHLTHVDDVFWQVQAVIRGNPDINVGTVFQDWIERCYVDSVTVGLRRLADRGRNVISLWRVLQEMLSVASHLSRERYLSLHDGPLRHRAEKWWGKLVGTSETYVTQGVIRAKQQELQAALNKVAAFANQNVAHLAAGPTHPATTFDDVRQSIVAAFRLYRWCSLVLKSEDPRSPVPKIQTNWLQVFRVPWIRPGMDVPKYRTLDELLRDRGKGSS